MKIHVKLNNKLEKANSLSNIFILYFYLNKPKNAFKIFKKALQAYQEALKVYTLDKIPMDYTRTQNNLGGCL